MRKNFKLILQGLFLAVLLLAGMQMTALARSGKEVNVGDTFDVPVECICGDASNWDIDTTSSCIEILYYNPGRRPTVTMYAVEEGNGALECTCQECGGETYYPITVSGGSHDIGLYLTESNLTLDEGDSYDLEACYDPGSKVDLRWSSSNDSVVSVSGRGGGSATLYAVGSGNATITVEDRKSGASDTCYVHVNRGEEYTISIDQPKSASYSVDDDARALEAYATVTAPDGSRTSAGITYQWYSGDSYSSTTHAISGATSPTYYPSTREKGTTYYACVATYAIGSVDVSDACSPVSVKVSGSSNSYQLRLEAEDSSIYAGDNTKLKVRVYDQYDSLITKQVTVQWSMNNTSSGKLDEKSNRLYSGKAENRLHTYNSDEATSIQVRAEICIDGKYYNDSVTVKVKASSDSYRLALEADKTTLTNGQSANLKAKLYSNGHLITASSPKVTWKLYNANGKASLQDTTTKSSNGTASNKLTVNNMSGSGSYNIIVSATVTLNGTDYTNDITILAQPGSVPIGANTIIMQINNRNITVGSTTFTNDVAPVIVNSRTMVPVRVISELLGGTVGWNADAQLITIAIDGKLLTMIVNQTIIGFDAAPVILGGRTYVPIRFIAEAIGADVGWDPVTQQITITKK